MRTVTAVSRQRNRSEAFACSLKEGTISMAKTKKSPSAAEKTLDILKAKTRARKQGMRVVKPPPRAKMAKQEAPKAPIRKASYSKQELEYFRKIILEKKKEILEELETLRDTMMDSTTG